MAFVAAVTDPDWINHLSSVSTHFPLSEVNFWFPGKSSFSESHVGKDFVFVKKGSEPRTVAGTATVHSVEQHTIRNAWDQWGIGNGVWSLEHFLDRIGDTQSTEAEQRNFQADTLIYCAILGNVKFFPHDDFNTHNVFNKTHGLDDFSKTIVRYKVYDDDLPSFLN